MGNERQRTIAGRIAESLGESGGKDHVNVSILPIDRGVKLRIDAESDLLKLIGKIRP